MDDEQSDWEDDFEDPEFITMEETTTGIPSHAGFNNLGVRLSGVDDDNEDDETDDDLDLVLDDPTANETEENINGQEELCIPKVYVDGPKPQTEDLPDDFHLAIMVFATSADLSVAQYQALREVLSFATIESIRTLPKSITTLKERCRKSMPLARLRKFSLPINTDKVPPKAENPKTAYRFEIEEYARLWLADRRMMRAMHFGMGLVETHRSEFWHGDCWLGSIRSTSGQFARLQACEEPLLPSDCVSYIDDNGRNVILRVHGIGVTPQDQNQVIVGKRLLPPERLPTVFQWPDCLQSISTQDPLFKLADSNLPELVLMEDDRLIIPVARLQKKEWVHFLDYAESDLSDTLLPEKPLYCVRYIAYINGSVAKIRGVHLRHRIPAEFELDDMGRKSALSNLVSDGTSTGLKHISVPYTLFLDDFGLYRNAYHSLAGLYIQPACLDEPGRFTLQNMFVLMIGPFGCTINDIATCLQDETVNLGRGIRTTIDPDDSPVILTVFPLCITGDMPQQNKNCGVMSHRSKKGCRLCYIEESSRGDLDFDYLQEGRYFETSRRLLEHIRTTTVSAKDRESAYSAQGMTPDGHIFGTAFTSLNPHTGYPSDPMHCELRLAKYFQSMLIEDVLSTTGIPAYQRAWNDMNVPYGWGQPQNPVSHKGSMDFSEHGRIALLNPLVLMKMFSKTGDNNQGFFKRGMPTKLGRQFANSNAYFDTAAMVIKISFSIAHVIYLTHKSELSNEEANALPGIILTERKLLRSFFLCGSTPNRASVPNMHLGLHYQQDICNYGTSRNVAAMIGEQKHKVHKNHAPHTNSRGTELQLVKSVNMSQTMRFLLDNAYIDNNFQTQFQRIVTSCPNLVKKFLGSSSAAANKKSGSVDTTGSMFTNIRGVVRVRRVEAKTRDADFLMLKSCWEMIHRVAILPSMKLHLEYFNKMTVKYQQGQHTREFGVLIGGFVVSRSEPRVFFRVERITTLSIETLVRMFLVVQRLHRMEDEEVMHAPYDVFAIDTKYVACALSVNEVEPMCVHMVQKSGNSWWWNPYVTRFI